MGTEVEDVAEVDIVAAAAAVAQCVATDIEVDAEEVHPIMSVLSLIRMHLLVVARTKQLSRPVRKTDVCEAPGRRFFQCVVCVVDLLHTHLK